MGKIMTNTKIELIKGDDTDFLNQVFLIISFKTNLDLNNYKCRLTIENSYNFTKQYEIQNNTVEISLNKIVSSTIEVGEHRCNIKLIDTLGRIKTVYQFILYVKDEYEPSIPLQNEHEIEIKLDDGISKYKNYEEQLNKPSINNVELVGNKTLDELGVTDLFDSKLKDYVTKDNLRLSLQKYAEITDIPDAREYATVDDFNRLVELVNSLQQEINKLKGE